MACINCFVSRGPSSSALSVSTGGSDLSFSKSLPKLLSPSSSPTGVFCVAGVGVGFHGPPLASELGEVIVSVLTGILLLVFLDSEVDLSERILDHLLGGAIEFGGFLTALSWDLALGDSASKALVRSETDCLLGESIVT